MKTPCRLFFALLVCAFVVTAARAADDVDQVIARARATVGTEAALSSLQSLHYVGSLTTTATDDKGMSRPVKVAIEIIFQRPYRQRIVATSENKIEITALDDYEGWQREQDPSDPTRWRMTLLSPDQVKRLRANTWENLSFFSGIEKRRGTAKDHGLVQVDGRSCRKLTFDHGDNIIFTRYFDSTTGRLQLTETENGIQIREEGEIEAGGIKFPKTITSTSKSSEGAERVVIITFDKVTVNETFADSLFAVPAMSR